MHVDSFPKSSAHICLFFDKHFGVAFLRLGVVHTCASAAQSHLRLYYLVSWCHSSHALVLIIFGVTFSKLVVTPFTAMQTVARHSVIEIIFDHGTHLQ